MCQSGKCRISEVILQVEVLKVAGDRHVVQAPNLDQTFQTFVAVQMDMVSQLSPVTRPHSSSCRWRLRSLVSI